MNLNYSTKKDISRIKKLIEERRQEGPPIGEIRLGALVHGDNFTVMARMLDRFGGMIDLVYIDPPFNTQNNFYCSEKRAAHISHSSEDQIAYSDKDEFERYLEDMRERLYLVSMLLSPMGTLYLHIDVKAGHYIKIILDEIFGRDAFINEITRIKSNPKNFQRKAYGNQKDVIFVYAVKPGKNIFNNLKEQLSESDLMRLYPKLDPTGRRYATVPCHAPGETRNGATGGSWKGLLPPPGRHWRCSPDELEKLDNQGLIEWSCNNVPRIIKYADQHEGKKIQDVWTDFKDPPYPLYPTEKNMEMLERIVLQSSNKNSLVMDCFCGSGAFIAAALRHGRRPIGIDRSETAINIARKRIELSRVPLVKALSPTLDMA